MNTEEAIKIANKIQLSDNPLWSEIKLLAEKDEKRIAELVAQIEKMKCCGNCKYSNQESAYSLVCKVGGVDKNDYIYTDDNQVCDKWEIKEDDRKTEEDETGKEPK